MHHFAFEKTEKKSDKNQQRIGIEHDWRNTIETIYELHQTMKTEYHIERKILDIHSRHKHRVKKRLLPTTENNENFGNVKPL